MKLSHLLLLLFLNFGWATIPTVATRVAGQLGAVEFVFLRYLFAFVAMAVVCPFLPGRLPRGMDFWKTVVMGVAVFNVGHLLQIAGIQLSSASDGSILLALDPLVSSLGAALFLHERIPFRRWIGFALGMAGVALMSLGQGAAIVPGFLANLLIVLSFISEAVWSVMGKPIINRWGIPKVALLALAAGTLANGCLLLGDSQAHWRRFEALSLAAWVSLAVLGVVLTAFGYSAWYLVIRETPVSVAAMTVYLQPVIGTALAVSFAGEKLHLGHFAGGTAIILGLVIGVWRRADTRHLGSIMPEK